MPVTLLDTSALAPQERDTATREILETISGRVAKSIGEHRQIFVPGEISLTDFSSPFQWSSAGISATMSFRFTFAELCLPAATIRSAAGSLGDATLELARAVVATVGHVDLARNDVANQALLIRIEAYVQQHLTDQALSPESIAHAHRISVRQLYKVWSARELSLAEWIMRGRLEGARHDIAKDGSAGIGVIARRWGFTDPTHFGRRFRAAYGLSPRDFRHAQDTRERARAAAG